MNIYLFQGACNEYDFKGGAGAAPSSNKEGGHKTGIKHVEEQSPKLKFEDELSDGENRDLMKATPARHSARTSGKRFKYCYLVLYLSIHSMQIIYIYIFFSFQNINNFRV